MRSGVRRGPRLVSVTSPSTPAAGCPVLGDGGTRWLPGRVGGWGSAAPMQGGVGLWQLVRMLLAFGSCFVRPRLRPWQRTRSQGPAGGVSSAPTTLMEALEMEQLPSPGPSPSPPSASLLPVTPNPLFSQRLTRLHSADLSPLRSPGGGPLGSAPSPPAGTPLCGSRAQGSRAGCIHPGLAESRVVPRELPNF